MQPSATDKRDICRQPCVRFSLISGKSSVPYFDKAELLFQPSIFFYSRVFDGERKCEHEQLITLRTKVLTKHKLANER